MALKSRHLIVLAKPPILGQAKTRLAKSVGKHKALEIYQLMLSKTFELAKSIDIPTTVFFTQVNSYTDNFSLFEFGFQANGDLGHKMKMAFQTVFEQGYQEVILIGTDCPDNTSNNLSQSFDALNNNDVVIGPSDDGGYYLIGMKRVHAALFDNKTWSTTSVYQEAQTTAKELGLTLAEMKMINDIDTLADLKKSNFYKFVRTID